MSAYRSGYRLECRVRQLLREKGYLVVRSAGSKGPVDLLAAKQGEILAIQVKRTGRLTRSEKEALLHAARQFRAKPVLAHPGRGGLVLEEVEPECR